jgi:SAM-dependent methyltransferase
MNPKTFARILSFIVRSLGFKKAGWNISFRAGISYGGPSPLLAEFISSQVKYGFIVEHGCGNGSLPSQLEPKTFVKYIGYDISAEAVLLARQANPSCEFYCKPMEAWRDEPKPVDLILCKEVAYYLSEVDLRAFIQRALVALKPAGKLIITIHDPHKHSRTVAICRESGLEIFKGGQPTILLAIRS